MSTVRIYPMTAEAETPARPLAIELPSAPSAPSMPSSLPGEHTLRRTGSRPYRFQGVELVSATGHATEGRLWHEINLFRTNRGKIIADLRVFKKSPTEKDSFYGAECDTVDEAAAWLEAFDPRQDVAADLPIDDPSISMAELSMHGAALRLRMEEATRQYKSVLGDLLYALRLPG